MGKIRNTLLFGAGAVIDWSGPTTSELTDLTRSSGFNTKDGVTKITEFIYTTLKDASGYSENNINFETIINVIEELIVYYAEHGLKNKLPSLLKAFFIPSFDDQLLNFSIIGERDKHFKLHIPGIADEFAIRSRGNESPEQFFFQQLLAHLLTDITIAIERYSYHTASKSLVLNDAKQALNQTFEDWVHKINGDNILRMYTLNYDRNFKIILSRSKYKYNIFEGFECTDVVGYNDMIKPNVKRIIDDQDTNVHFNLHGSVFWRVEALNQYQLELPEFYLACGAYLEQNTDEFPTFQSEKGKTVFLTNFITGHQKTQRAIFSPFKQMQASFDRDCIFSNQLIIVGYSFGDEHINSSIRTALSENNDMKLIIIDPSFKVGGFDLNVMLRIFAASNHMHAGFPTNLAKDVHGFLGGRVIVHAKTFKAYMEDCLKGDKALLDCN